MPPPRYERIISAIDVGTWKVCALICGQTADGTIDVLGAGHRESEGMRRGSVADMGRVEEVVRAVIEHAERMAGRNIDDVFVSFSSGDLTSGVLQVEHELGGQRIGQGDIDELLMTARQAIDPQGRLVLHAQPAMYTLDGVAGVRSPLGLHAERLGVDIHVVLADGSPVRNLETAVRAAHLDVRAVVASPIAAGLSCLTEEERDLGVALVELGAAVTNIALYAGGMLVGLQSLPFGAADITDDIASSFGLRRSDAQRLQSYYGSALPNPRDNADMIATTNDELPGRDPPRIARSALIGVIRARLDAMMNEIGRSLKEMGFTGPVGHQVVLTGGGAELKGLADHAQAALGRASRIGRPVALPGLPEAQMGPGFATLVGTILHASLDRVDLRDLTLIEAQGGRTALPWWSRIYDVLRQGI